MSNILWALYVRGPDDVVAMPDYKTAVAFSDWFTAVDRANIADEMAPVFAAIPMQWPWSADEHADEIAQRTAAPPSQREYPLDVPRASLPMLTEIARKHPPLCRFFSEAARVRQEG